MQILIVGIGALGGTIAARALRAGLPVRLAARNTESAEVLRRSGLRVSGIGGEVEADTIELSARFVRKQCVSTWKRRRAKKSSGGPTRRRCPWHFP